MRFGAGGLGRRPNAHARSFQAAIAAPFRFLRQPSRPNAPRPVAKRGRAAGSGVKLADVEKVVTRATSSCAVVKIVEISLLESVEKSSEF